MPPCGAGAKHAAVQGGPFQAIGTYMYHVCPRSNVLHVVLVMVRVDGIVAVVYVAAQSSKPQQNVLKFDLAEYCEFLSIRSDFWQIPVPTCE